MLIALIRNMIVVLLNYQRRHPSLLLPLLPLRLVLEAHLLLIGRLPVLHEVLHPRIRLHDLAHFPLVLAEVLSPVLSGCAAHVREVSFRAR